jgi:hypothetical protein
MEDSFNPGSLQRASTYYWRVDQVNSNGTTPGPVWSFTTEPGGSGGPGLATAPSPAQRAAKVLRGAALSWTAGTGVQLQELYFGPAGALGLVASGLSPATTTWNPSGLSAGVAYEWRVDGVATGVTEGDLWAFEVSPTGLAKRALPIAPTHLEGSTPAGTVLVWSAGAKALSHDVYFGTSFPLQFQGNQSALWWDPGPLTSGQAYYWRVDEVNGAGTTTGWTWRFGP